jgi:cellulose synthase/poly-beta-1,6-N-acetylglucosamine synthase-like glycosyltransferase
LIVFYFFLVCFLFSYLAYPASLRWFYRNKKKASSDYKVTNFSEIHVLISAFNEEKIIQNTLEKLAQYAQNASIYIASDGSNDQTDAIVKQFILDKPYIHFVRYERIGKGNAINQLIVDFGLKKETSCFIFMDANIELNEHTIPSLMAGFVSPKIGIVGTSVLSSNTIQNSESAYIEKENEIKYLEGALFGSTIGVFGACFAMRAHLYELVPSHFITDDLFHTFQVINQKHEVVYSREAVVYEYITDDISNEFQRKKRYAAGNFQIFFRFFHLLNPFKTSFGFIYSYWNHKIVRWFSPIVFLFVFLQSFLFESQSLVFDWINKMGIALLFYLGFNFLLYKFEFKPIFAKLFYFLAMNIAILIGFFNYIKGIKSNVWNRSKRF